VAKWGEEAGKAELEVGAAVVHDYLVAVVEKDWAKTCSLASEFVTQRLGAHPKTSKGGCAAILAAYAKPPLPSTYDSSEVEAESMRATDDWAFLLYRAAKARYYMPLVKENDGWKVNLVAPIAFDN
jgi:hypothetical protein